MVRDDAAGLNSDMSSETNFNIIDLSNFGQIHVACSDQMEASLNQDTGVALAADFSIDININISSE
jgi:hypothetical protein